MIVMVTSVGPSTGASAGTGFNITVPQLEKIHSGSGKMTMVMMNGTMPAAGTICHTQCRPIVTGVSGNIATIRLVSASGPLFDKSAVLSGVEFVLIADGY